MGKRLIILILVLMSLAFASSTLAHNPGSCSCTQSCCESAAFVDNCNPGYGRVCQIESYKGCGAPCPGIPNYVGCDCCGTIGYACEAASDCCTGLPVCSNLHCCPSGNYWTANRGAAGGNCGSACCPTGQEYVNTGTGCKCQVATEICNGADDDFDGSIDEPFQCRQGSTCCTDTCTFVANNVDPGGDCASCKVCNGAGACKNATVDTDVKNNCGVCKVCNGAGACKNAIAGTDVKNNCAVGTWGCVGGNSPNVCVRQRNSGDCVAGGVCGVDDEKAAVGGNLVCAGSGANSNVTPTTTKYCDTNIVTACAGGDCSGTATTYYHGCTINNCNLGTGACDCTTGTNSPTTTVATVNAAADKVLTAACGNQDATSQALACDDNADYFCTAGTCSGYYRYSECNGAGTCNAAANTFFQQYNVNANAGSSLTASCGLNGASPCDATQRLSSGPGDGNYGAGGAWFCQGFCDGGGVCDFAGACVPAVICGDGVIDAPETCELPSTINNANCPQSVLNCVGAMSQTRDGFGNCNMACSCSLDAWSALTCSVGSCGAVCSSGATRACVTAQGYAGTQSCDVATCGWGACNPVEWCGDGLVNGPEACEPVGSCQSGFVCNASCQWQATVESIAAGNCNDGADNNCNGEADYSGVGLLHGDSGCPVGVTAVNGPASVCPGQNFQVRCTRSTPVTVTSISARIDGQSACSFNSWSGADAVFDCTAPAALGSYTVRCFVDATKSYVTPPDRTYSLAVGGASCCAQYTAQGQGVCEGDVSCDWCPDCVGTLYSGGTSRCVVAGSCTFLCNRDPADLTVPYDYCGAVCDNTDAPCALQTRCTGTLYETNSAVCSPACACNYAGWAKGTCTDSKANCNAACSTGETQACTTVDGYLGAQTCDEATCTFGVCTSALFCGDNIVTSPPEDCDPTGTCQPPGTLGTYCNATCKWQVSPLENAFVNGCSDDLDNDCDGMIDGEDADCPEGAGINAASLHRVCDDGLPQDSVPPCTDPRCALPGAAYSDRDDFKCSDLCTGVNATTGQVLMFDNETPPYNVNYFGQPFGVSFTDWESYNGVNNMFCCGDDVGEWYRDSFSNSYAGDDGFPIFACCNDSSHCIDQVGHCQIGVEETFDLCTDGLDNDCDGLTDGRDVRCGGNVVGFVFNDKGFRVPGAVVKSSPPGMGSSFENSTLTDGYGHYVLRSIVGNYTFIARREGYDDNAVFVNVLPDGVTEVNFTLRNGSCHADCTDYYGNCNPACEGLSFVNNDGQLETCSFINALCYNRPKNFRATSKNLDTNITTEYTCCKGPERTYKTLKATVTGNMKDLYDYVLNINFMGRQAKLHILTWNSE